DKLANPGSFSLQRDNKSFSPTPNSIKASASRPSSETCKSSRRRRRGTRTDRGGKEAMNFPKLLVSATSEADGRGGVLFVDLQQEVFRVVLPYRVAGMAVTRDAVTFAHIDQDKTLTRVEVFDSKGLAWSRRVPNCVDTHSLRLTSDHIVLCSTGTNQVIF